MQLRKVASSLLQRINNPTVIQVAKEHHLTRHLAGREIVGWGVNGFPHYPNKFEYPFQAVRFIRNRGDLTTLKEKQKDILENLSEEEKRAIHLASYYQVFSHADPPDGNWKSATGAFLFIFSLALWAFMWLQKYVFSSSARSKSEETRRAQFNSS